MEHIVEFVNGHDCVKFECAWDNPDCKPGGTHEHGASGLKISFVSKGEDGAVQFVLSTGWLPQFADPSRFEGRRCQWGGDALPHSLAYHSKLPMREEQRPSSCPCEYCDGVPCYCDGSFRNADDAMYALVNGGLKALWEFLDAYYENVFRGTPYPVPAEYRKPLR